MMQYGKFCFGHIDKPEHAKRKFDSKRQLESKTIAVFEQGFRSIFREAWPIADIKAKELDSMLQLRFVDGCFDHALQQSLLLHSRNDDFETTVGKHVNIWTLKRKQKLRLLAKSPMCAFQ